MEKARDTLVDRVIEAGDMAWGAFVHQLKTFADQRRWEYETRPFYEFYEKLKKDLDDPKVDGLCIRTESLDEDFLVDSVSLEQMNYRIEGTKELIQMMKAADLSPPKPNE